MRQLFLVSMCLASPVAARQVVSEATSDASLPATFAGDYEGDVKQRFAAKGDNGCSGQDEAAVMLHVEADGSATWSFEMKTVAMCPDMPPQQLRTLCKLKGTVTASGPKTLLLHGAITNADEDRTTLNADENGDYRVVVHSKLCDAERIFPSLLDGTIQARGDGSLSMRVKLAKKALLVLKKIARL